jgi:hypothetical protein
MFGKGYCHGSSLDLTFSHVTVDIRVKGAILAHSKGTTGTLGRSHFRLSIKPGIPLSRILVSRSSTNIIPDPILHPGTVIQTENKIYVHKSNWITDRFSDGLNNHYLGFYKILNNLYSNEYKINFSPNIKARRFLNANRLMKIWDDVVPGQVLIFPNLVEINDKLE